MEPRPVATQPELMGFADRLGWEGSTMPSGPRPARLIEAVVALLAEGKTLN